MNADGPDVTVVVTTHDRRAMLAEAVASVRRQTGVTWELVVVDDGSADDTRAWLAAELDPRRERALLRPPEGRSRAANAGLADARGRYVLFLDDDDVLLPGALATLESAISAHPRATAAIGARLRAVAGSPRRMNHPSHRLVRDAHLDLLAWWSAVPGQALHRADVARAVGGFPDAWPNDDHGLLLAVAARGPFAFVPDAVMQYRVHEGQHSRPADLPEIWRQVAADALARLPEGRRRAGAAAWAAGRRRQRADAELAAGRPAKALALYVGSAATAPALARSPLLWPMLARGVLGACGGLFRPARRGA